MKKKTTTRATTKVKLKKKATKSFPQKNSKKSQEKDGEGKLDGSANNTDDKDQDSQNGSDDDKHGSNSLSLSDSIKVTNKSFIKPITKDINICLSCGLVPCEKDNYEEILEKEGQDKAKESGDHNKAIHHHLYKFFIAAKYGKFGNSNRVQIPLCIETFICTLYLDPMGNYTGFRESIGTCDYSNQEASDDEKSDFLGFSGKDE